MCFIVKSTIKILIDIALNQDSVQPEIVTDSRVIVRLIFTAGLNATSLSSVDLRNLSAKRCHSYRKDEILLEKVLSIFPCTSKIQTAMGALIDGCD